VAEIFRIHVISNPDVRTPVVTFGTTTFFHIRTENMYICAVSKLNVNTALVFEFLYKFVEICKAYFGKLDEDVIKDNYVLVYELLDEILDFGYPQTSETDTLKQYISQEEIRSDKLQSESKKITIQATGAISWRKEDIKYRKNECFIDIIESLNLIMSNKGAILRVDVAGQVMVKAFLSGMPECKFGLNDKLLMERSNAAAKKRQSAVELDDVQFHQCVKLGRFDVDRTISFVPPDGEFELMKYRTTENINLPFRVHAIVNEIGRSRVEYKVVVKATFAMTLAATNVRVFIPTPTNTAAVRTRETSGKAKFKPGDGGIMWKIPRFQGGLEFSISADAELSATTVKKTWSRPPISLDFSVPMFAASGLHVRFLKVFEKSNYQTVKWVRYITRAGSCQYRI
jgi:AP-2 complex subunit mu-1